MTVEHYEIELLRAKADLPAYDLGRKPSAAPANRFSVSAPDGRDVVSAGDSLEFLLELARPCEDVSAVLLCDHRRGGGLQGFPVNRTNAVEMRAADASRRVWKASVPVSSCGTAKPRQVYVKCTTLGGGLALPLFTSFACGFDGKNG